MKSSYNQPPSFKRAENKTTVLNYILGAIMDDFHNYYVQQEHQLLVANETPTGFRVGAMHFGTGIGYHLECKPELLDRAKEVWGIKQKYWHDRLKLTNYFQKILARCTSLSQLYCYIPTYLHPKLNELLKGPESLRVPIDDLEPDPEIIKLMDFYVMFRLLA